jgi:hypothetical protein
VTSPLLAPDRGIDAFRGQLEAPVLDDPELIRRSAELLAAYLNHAAGTASRRPAEWRAGVGSGNGAGSDVAVGAMSQAEALAILGLEHGASAAEIRAAHRRLAQKVHPDRGGSNYLTVKINQAKDPLLGDGNGGARSSPRGSSRKPGHRPAHR